MSRRDYANPKMKCMRRLAITRVLRSRTAIVLLMLALVGDVLCMSSREGGSWCPELDSIATVTGQIRYLLSAPIGNSRHTLGKLHDAAIVQTPTGEVYAIDHLPQNRLVPWPNNVEQIGHVYLWESKVRVGLHAPARERRSLRLSVYRSDVEYSTVPSEVWPEVGRVLGLMLAARPFGQEYSQSERDELLAGTYVNHDRPLYAGIAHNALSLAMLCSLIHGIRARMRWRTEQRRLAAFRCPACKYDIRGFASPVCPECGGSLPGMGGTCCLR